MTSDVSQNLPLRAGEAEMARALLEALAQKPRHVVEQETERLLKFESHAAGKRFGEA
jgi:hypothetical protein